MTRPRKPHLELVSVDGKPTDEEKRALQRALEEMTEHDREAHRASMWLRAGRAQGRRLGNLDYRDRLSREDAWRLSTRFPFGGREYPGLNGRGDAK
ncbi:MAG: hypothetical protein QOG54_2074 [Actinomycetota bacterium]|jgi:hypothetical protein|nr:hypothetical protein [Actinomycetota bacterium]